MVYHNRLKIYLVNRLGHIAYFAVASTVIQSVSESGGGCSCLMVPWSRSGGGGKSGIASLCLDPFLRGSPKDGRLRRGKFRRPCL